MNELSFVFCCVVLARGVSRAIFARTFQVQTDENRVKSRATMYLLNSDKFLCASFFFLLFSTFCCTKNKDDIRQYSVVQTLTKAPKKSRESILSKPYAEDLFLSLKKR